MPDSNCRVLEREQRSGNLNELQAEQLELLMQAVVVAQALTRTVPCDGVVWHTRQQIHKHKLRTAHATSRTDPTSSPKP